jgi:uncharacterized protein (DUF169 family)
MPNYADLAKALVTELNLSVAPIAITFTDSAPVGVKAFDAAMPAPTADGRTGRVSAGCVFWMHAPTRTFTTVAADHGNCSVGSVTHGFKTLAEVADKADVAELLGCGWVDMAAVTGCPTVKDKKKYVVYGPLSEAKADPDVVLLRVNGHSAMRLKDSLPDILFQGKPQCHIIALSKEQGLAAISSGCQLSRVRTGMANEEMTATLPAKMLPEIVAKIRAACGIDRGVATYAAEDSRRFGGSAKV